MIENENLVPDGAENVETTTEEVVEQVEIPEKTFTQSQLKEIVKRDVARAKAKVHKEYERKYGDLESVLKAGTGKESVEEMTDTFRKFYASKGVDIPQAHYSDRDIEVLAKAEADEIIGYGLEEVAEEVNRLADKGIENMTPREKAVFKTLAEYRGKAEKGSALEKIGVTEDVYNSKEFNDFASKFNSSTPITEIYELYSKTQPQKEVHTIGTLKNNSSRDEGVKNFYTRDEALKFTKADFDKNPALYKAVEKSMQKW